MDELLATRNERVGEPLREALVEMGERLRSFEERLAHYDERTRFRPCVMHATSALGAVCGSEH